MAIHFKLDTLDRRILQMLTADARIPFVEVARKCKVSGAAVHQRMARMTEAGLISGSGFHLSPAGMGYMTCAFIGIQVNLTSTSTHNEVFEKSNKYPK